MKASSSILAKINHQKAIAQYLHISSGELDKLRTIVTLFNVKAPKQFAVSDITFYRNEKSSADAASGAGSLSKLENSQKIINKSEVQV
jgi:hypothetical protein